MGVEAVDLSYADQRGIMVTNTPGANSGAVAEHALALMLSALRHVTAGDRRVRRGDWQVQRTRELGSLTVGIVGVGRIGRGVADRLSGFSTVLGYDPWVDEETFGRPASTSLTEMATRSDVVSLHAPGDARLVDRDWLSMVKPSLILVNTARAMLVDELAVAEALAEDRLQLYATDTLSAESGTDSRLLDPQLTDRTIFTPHSAAHTVEAVDKMSGGAVAAVLAMLSGDTPADVVRPGPSKEIG